MGQETFKSYPSAFISLLTIFFTATCLYHKFDDYINNKGIKIES